MVGSLAEGEVECTSERGYGAPGKLGMGVDAGADRGAAEGKFAKMSIEGTDPG